MRANVSRIRWVGLVAVACWAMMLTGSERAGALPARATRSAFRPGEAASVSLADPALRGKIEPALFKRLATATADEMLPVVVEMLAQADVSAAAARLPDRIAAGAGVVESLRATADSSQRDVRAFLAAEESAGRASDVRPLWIVNAVAAHAAPQTVAQLAAQPDVALVRLDRWMQRLDTNFDTVWLEPDEYTKSLISAQSGLSQTSMRSLKGTDFVFYPLHSVFPSPISSPQSPVEWGIGKIRADEVWAAFNITGTGVVVANMDTGVDWLHPALAGNYRGCIKSLCQHATSWFDATDGGALYPQDGHGHGTHTMGAIAGQGGIGVAPGARWIATRVLNAGGIGYDSWIHAGFQWILAPGDDPAKAPDVLSNSWGNDNGGDTTFRNDLRALRAAGILPIFSNGNKGPGGGAVGSPASLPEAFAVGATDNTDMVANFSSRGPSPFGLIRPHVVAPGVNVRSAWPGGGYKSLNGTSMAAPHVAGVVALMLSARSGTTLTTTAYVLTTTAVPLTTTTPNNDSGWGRVDAYAAVMAVANAGVLSGTVRNADTSQPIPGALVSVNGLQNALTQTDANGRYLIGVASGVYHVSVSAFGYEAGSDTVVIGAGQPLVRDFSLAPLPTGTVRGTITDAGTGLPVTATVEAGGTPVTQMASGVYSLTLPAGAYTLRATALGYRVLTATVTITAGEVTAQNLAMSPAPKILLVDSGAWYSQSEIGYFQQALDGLGYFYDTWTIRSFANVPRGSDLAPYDVVIWSSPQDSPGYVEASNAITTFLTNTHSLMISGQDVAFWDGGGSGLMYEPYLNDYLKTRYVQDDSGSRALVGLGGEIMSGLAMTITGPGGANNQIWPDVITVSDLDHASQILAYQGDGSGGQKVGLCLPYRGAVLSFGYEAITDAATRLAVMQRALDYFASPSQPAGLELLPANETLVAPPGSTVTHTLRLRNTGEIAGDAVTLSVAGGAWPHTLTPAATMVSSCEAITVTLVVTVPQGLGWNVMSVVTLTAQSSLSPSVKATSVLTTKTPAPVLLVDSERPQWYARVGSYEQALAQAGLAYDTWHVKGGNWPNPPSVSRLSWYPVVVWFTGYDWYDPISAVDEANMSAYLDGGGRLFLSSPFYLDMLGYLDPTGVPAFARTRLGVISFTDGLTTEVAYGAASSPIGGELGALPLTNPYPNAGFFTLAEALVPGRDAMTALRGSSGRALAIHRVESRSRTVFMLAPFEALTGSDAARMMGRTVGWLGWLGDSTLTASRGVAAAGDSVEFTLTARHNGVAPIHATLTATLPLSVTLIPESLTPGAGFDLASGVVTWTGVLDPGAAITVSYRVTLTGTLVPPGTPLTTLAVFHDDTHGISFDPVAVVRLAAPDLSLSTFTAPPLVRPNAPLTYTLVVSNSGLSVAASAHVTVLLPLHTRVVTNSLALSGPGSVIASSDTIAWSGSLDVGQSATLAYRLSTAGMLTGRALPSEALLWDGAGGAWERVLAVDVVPYRVYLPFVLRKAIAR